MKISSNAENVWTVAAEFGHVLHMNLLLHLIYFRTELLLPTVKIIFLIQPCVEDLYTLVVVRDDFD
jgi:hypothetical protein